MLRAGNRISVAELDEVCSAEAVKPWIDVRVADSVARRDRTPLVEHLLQRFRLWSRGDARHASSKLLVEMSTCALVGRTLRVGVVSCYVSW